MLGIWLVGIGFVIWLAIGVLMIRAQTVFREAFAAKTGQDLLGAQQYATRPWLWFLALPALLQANRRAVSTTQQEPDLERLRVRYATLRVLFITNFVVFFALAALFMSSPQT